MAQPNESSTQIVNKMLKIDGLGWNISLFEDVNKISNYLCAHCGFVCCDTVELGCDHDEDDEEIFLYCKFCLTELVKDNDNKCMISGHYNPPLDASRAIRRQILKAIVVCPYSTIFKTRNNLKNNKNNNAQMIDTNGYDEKEGSQQFVAAVPGNDKKSEQICEWQGALSELKSKHINQCAKMNDPTFTLNFRVKKLENENILLKQQIINLKNNKEKELNNNNKEIKKLKEIIKEKEIKTNVLNNEIVVLKNENKNNKKQLNDNKTEINKLNSQINSQSLIIKDFLKSNDKKNELIKNNSEKEEKKKKYR
eukprot:429448_1